MIFLTLIFYAAVSVFLTLLPLWLAHKEIISDSMGFIGAMIMLILSFVIMIGNIVAGSSYILDNNKCNVETTEISLYQMSDYGDNIFVVTTIGNEITYLVRCDTDNGPQYTEFNTNHTTIVEDNCANPYITYTHKWLSFPLNIIFPIDGHDKNDQYEIHISMDKIKTLYH